MKAIRGTIARPDSGEKDISERQRRRARASVITVGDGHGFVVNDPQDTRLVVTAAHCLPFFPPADSASHLSKRTYERLLAPLGTKPAIWAECLFVDPIADMAVLGSPDDQELSNEAGAYAELLQCATPISIAEAPREGHAWALSLECEWFRCSVKHIFDGPLLIFDAAQPLAGGMSGCPGGSCGAIEREHASFSKRPAASLADGSNESA
jgi:hypothetical protein